jgi:hypothetical protein
MGTAFSEIITGYAMQDIDDIRWQEQLANNAAQFFRAKSQALINSIPRFNKPVTMEAYLTFTSPTYDDYLYTPTTAQNAPITIQTGKSGYELCNTGITQQGPNGAVTYTSCANTYDSATGDVVVNVNLAVGQNVEIDFYTDGTFDNVLTNRQKRILGLCMVVDWHYQFANTYLGMINVVTDKTFNVRSPSEHIRVTTDRVRANEQKLASEIAAYEQSVYALGTIPKGIFPKI